MAKKLQVDKDKCIGCGTCVALAPKTFKIGQDSKSIVIDPPGDDEATIKTTIDSCPVEAIAWTE